MAKRLQRSGHYYGLRKIAEVAGCSTTTLLNRILRYGFPAFRTANGDQGGASVCWYTNDQLLMAWYNVRVEQSREYLIASKTGKSRAYTRESIELHQMTTDDGSWIDPPEQSD